MSQSVVWLSKTLAILNNSIYALLRIGTEIVHVAQAGHTVRFIYYWFPDKIHDSLRNNHILHCTVRS